MRSRLHSVVGFELPTRSIGQFRSDERAIEGLPIRLVIALVVGVASLGVMMNMVSGIGGLGVAELDVEPEPDVIDEDRVRALELRVVDPEGAPVSDATVVVSGESARLPDGPLTAETGDDGVATVTVRPELGPNQKQGTISVDVQPPAGSDYVDRRENADVLVLDR